MQEERKQAFDLVKEFRESAPWEDREDLDFYKLLWVVHWGIETYGFETVQSILHDLFLDPQVTPHNAAVRLRNILCEQESDEMANWFYKAMNTC